MVNFRTTVTNPIGFVPQNVDGRVYNRTGETIAVGDLVMFDLSGSDAAVTAGSITGTDSIFGNVIDPATSQLDFGWYGIALSGGADDAIVKVRVQGVVEANVVGGAAAGVLTRLYAVNNQDQLDSAATPNTKALGMLIDATSAGTEEQVTILFDGINGVMGNTVDDAAATTVVHLTDSTGGTGGDTIANLADGSTYANDHAAIENNFASLTDKIEEIMDVLDAAGLTSPS